MYFLFSLDFPLFQYEKIKAERLYVEVHAYVIVKFADEKMRKANFAH